MRRGQLGSGAPRVGGESPGVGPPHKGVSMGQGPGRAVVSAMGGRTFLTVGVIPVLGFGNLLLCFVCGTEDFWGPRNQAGVGQDRGVRH